MESKKSSQQRHFPYQHPTFGRGSKKKHEDAWWYYLKHNEEYIKTCEKSGKGSLFKLYEDFGDVRSDYFKNWWSSDSRGGNLFSDPPAQETLRIVPKDEIGSLDEDLLLMSVPLNLPKKFLLQRFRTLLAEKHKEERGKQYAKRSKATYQFKGQPNIDALMTALNALDRKRRVPTMKLWELGQFLPQFKHLYKEYIKNGTPLDTRDKKLIEATVSRYIKKASLSVDNTSRGMFP